MFKYNFIVRRNVYCKGLLQFHGDLDVPIIMDRFKVLIVHCCQTFSQLSPSGLKTRIEKLLPDVKKQPLGITRNVLCALLSSRQMLNSEWRVLWLSLTWLRWLVKAVKKSPVLRRTFLMCWILKARNRGGFWRYSYQLSFRISFLSTHWMQIVVVRKIIDDEIQRKHSLSIKKVCKLVRNWELLWDWNIHFFQCTLKFNIFW